MLHDTEGFVRLPNERILYTSPPRTSLSLQAVNTPPGTKKFSVNSSSGRVHLTNQRVCPVHFVRRTNVHLLKPTFAQVVYLPAEATPQFQSFSAPLVHLRDTYVSAPFFGPNVWSAQVQPVPGGGIPPSSVAIQLKMTFKDGGAFDFHTNFERIKERLDQVVENTQESGHGRGAFGSLNFTDVHLEDLPAYEGPAPGAAVSQPPAAREQESAPQSNFTSSRGEDRFDPPSEPPPGYEEVQQQSIANELETRLRQAQ